MFFIYRFYILLGGEISKVPKLVNFRNLRAGLPSSRSTAAITQMAVSLQTRTYYLERHQTHIIGGW